MDFRRPGAAEPDATCLTDPEWAITHAVLPPPTPCGRPLRWLVDAVIYVLRTGCVWRYLPRDYPLWQTVLRWSLRLAAAAPSSV